MTWNLGDILDAVAKVVPGDRPAITQGDHTITWAAFDQRTNRMARAFVARGLAPGQTVAILARNTPAYIEAFAASLKARLVPVNINYRYKADEIAYIFRDAGIKAVVFQREFAPVVESLRQTFPDIGLWLCIEGDCGLAGVVPLEDLAGSGDGAPLDIARSGSDPFLLYTGGTTGYPKGVVWPADATRASQLESPLVKQRPANLAEHVDIVHHAVPGRVMPACPLMHGAGINSTLSELLNGGSVVLLPSTSFDAEELWRIAARERVTRILIVGDAFARPMMRALEALHAELDLGALKVVSSSGLMFSREAKQALIGFIPHLTIVDIYGASEASGLGYSTMTARQEVPTGRFIPGPKTVLLTEDERILGEGDVGEGWIARSAPLPDGYLGDPVKTAQVFREVRGVRYAIPGDWARRYEDGTMGLVGRGNLVINTGGEKVYVEEVEEALKREAQVDDAIVVGVPDELWGSIVVAVVRTRNDQPIDTKTIEAGVRETLAGYKVPKAFVQVREMPRSPSGKSDYKGARDLATAHVQKNRPGQASA